MQLPWASAAKDKRPILSFHPAEVEERTQLSPPHHSCGLIWFCSEEGYSRSSKELIHEDAQRPEVDRSVMTLHEDTNRQYSDDGGGGDEDNDDDGDEDDDQDNQKDGELYG